ncbi:MAG TPA: aspartate aminotransferase family protein [Clostridia bacterium]|nr:aspartate aminotransferase family protein [Clostridia bacterium]
MSVASVQKAEAALLLPTYDRHPLLLKRGQGVYLYNSEGKRYLDFLSGIGVNALGYNHPAIRKALVQQAGKLVHVSNLFFHDYQSALAERLTKASGLDRVFFCNSGTEAWEGALKLARAYAGHVSKRGSKPKWRVLAMENSFHGRTFGSLATTGQPKYRKPFAPGVPGVRFVRLNDVADLQAKFDSTVCAITLETIQGEGGIRPVSAEFLNAARALCNKSGAVLILDEIQCGLGRTGRMFAYQHYGVRPDIVTVAKPLAAGLPLGAILTTEVVSKAFHPGMHGTTFGGGPLACAVAIAYLDTLKSEKLLAHVTKTGEYFRERLQELDQRHAVIQDIRGVGLMLGVEVSDADLAKSVVAKMLELGIIINRTHDTTLRFLPPFIITSKHVDQVVKALDSVLTSCTGKKSLARKTKRKTMGKAK